MSRSGTLTLIACSAHNAIMSSPALRLVSVVPVAPRLEPRELPFFTPEVGTLVELSGAVSSGRTTMAAAIARRAQAEGETVAWVMHDTGGAYAPNLATAKLDLEALALVRVPRREGPKALVRAAEILLRSGGLGLVVLDFVDGAPGGPPAAWQGRLLGLAREHCARIVLLSSSDDSADSLGPLVTVRLAPRRARVADGFLIGLSPLKVKNGRLDRVAPSLHRAPAGL